MNEYIKDGLRVFVVPVDILDREDLTIHEKMTYVVLRSYANPYDLTAFPSYATIAMKGSMSRRQAIRCVENLVKKGLLRKEMRYTVTKNQLIKKSSNVYMIGHPGGDSQSPGVVTHSHQGGDSQSPGVVTHSHQGGDSQSPDQIHIKDPDIKKDLDQIDPDIKKAIEETGLSNHTHDIIHVYKTNHVSKEIFLSVLRRVAEKKDKVQSIKGYLIRSLKNEASKVRTSGLPESVVSPKVQEISEEEAKAKQEKAESLLKQLYQSDKR